MNLRFLVSLSFCAFCVLLLINERNEVAYKFEHWAVVNLFDQQVIREFDLDKFDLEDAAEEKQLLNELDRLYLDKTGLYQHLFCVPINEIFKNRKELDLAKLNDDLVRIFNESYLASAYHANLKSNSAAATRSKDAIRYYRLFKLFVLEPTKSKNYYIYKNQICLILDYPFIRKVLGKVFKESRYLMLTKGFYSFVELANSESPQDNLFDQVLVLNQDHPKLNCSDNYLKFQCLNDCFREKSRLARYFYNGNESGRVQLDHNLEHVYDEEPDKSVLEHERNCFKKCENNGCNFIYTFRKDFSNEIRRTIYKAYPLIPRFYFWVQFVGLILSFFGVSCYELIFKFAKKSVFKLGNKAILAFRVSLFLVCLVLFFGLASKIICDYKTKLEKPVFREATIFLSQPEPIGLVICIPVQEILADFRATGHHAYALDRNYAKYANRTFLELEKATDEKDAFNRTVEGIYLQFQNKRFNVSWQLKPKVLFYASREFNYLSRCYQIDVMVEEPRYQSLLSISKLTLATRHAAYFLFLLPDGKDLNSNVNYLHDNQYDFLKQVAKNRPELGHCVEYGQEYATCNNRLTCNDQCVHNESLANNMNISAYFVVDKDQFSVEAWSKLFHTYSTDEYKELRAECYKRLAKPDCLESKYIRHTKSDRSAIGNLRRQFDLYYYAASLIEELPSRYALILSLLNIQGIIFNLDVLQLVTFLSFIFKMKFNMKGSKFYLPLLYLTCFVGFLLHVSFIFFGIKNDELVNSEYYEELNMREMPDALFCFDFRHSLAGQANVTGNDLEELTKEINAERVFERISYLDRQNRWVDVDRYSGFKTNDFSIHTFYMIDKKCFQLKININYELHQFYFKNEPENTVLKVDFYSPFILRSRGATFFAKKRDKFHFSKPVNLMPYKRYSVSQELYDIYYNDRFQVLKNPMSIFKESYLNDADLYLKSLRDDFKERYNATTMSIPLEKPDFQLKIDDQLFRDYYYAEQSPKDQSTPGNLNYERQYFLNYIKEQSLGREEDIVLNFEFNLIFRNEKLEILNEDNWAKLILNLINVLSIWLSLNMFEALVFRTKLLNRQVALFCSQAFDQSAF